MNFEELEKKVIEWADARRMFDEDHGTDSVRQFMKLLSEVSELGDGITKRSQSALLEIEDGIGDATVVLIIIAYLNGMSMTRCLEYAYNEIADRKGKMVNGIFVKE